MNSSLIVVVVVLRPNQTSTFVCHMHRNNQPGVQSRLRGTLMLERLSSSMYKVLPSIRTGKNEATTVSSIVFVNKGLSCSRLAHINLQQTKLNVPAKVFPNRCYRPTNMTPPLPIFLSIWSMPRTVYLPTATLSAVFHKLLYMEGHLSHVSLGNIVLPHARIRQPDL